MWRVPQATDWKGGTTWDGTCMVRHNRSDDLPHISQACSVGPTWHSQVVSGARHCICMYGMACCTDTGTPCECARCGTRPGLSAGLVACELVSVSLVCPPLWCAPCLCFACTSSACSIVVLFSFVPCTSPAGGAGRSRADNGPCVLLLCSKGVSQAGGYARAWISGFLAPLLFGCPACTRARVLLDLVMVWA